MSELIVLKHFLKPLISIWFVKPHCFEGRAQTPCSNSVSETHCSKEVPATPLGFQAQKPYGPRMIPLVVGSNKGAGWGQTPAGTLEFARVKGVGARHPGNRRLQLPLGKYTHTVPPC